MNIVNETFTCAECRRELPVSTNGGTGYTHEALTECLICYDCVAKADVSRMMELGRIVLYLDLNHMYIQNWPGTLTLQLKSCCRYPHNIAGTQNHVWFIGPDGAKWHGVSFGDSQILRCNRLKRQKKNLTPLPKTTYFKPYPYENCPAN